MKLFSTGLLVLALNLLPAGGIAADTPFHQTMDGVAIYIGVVPAGLIRGHPPDHPEAQMHGSPGFSDSHLTVALYSADSGQRIHKAEVYARVTNTRGYKVRKPLELMLIADKPTFGNYFFMSGGAGPYRIDLEIRLPGETRPVAASFVWFGT